MLTTTATSHAAKTTTAPARNAQTDPFSAIHQSATFHCRSCQPSTKKGRIPTVRASEKVESTPGEYPTATEASTAQSSGNRSSTRYGMTMRNTASDSRNHSVQCGCARSTLVLPSKIHCTPDQIDWKITYGTMMSVSTLSIWRELGGDALEK